MDKNNLEGNKLNINWYPGHMAKTRRQILEDLKIIDVVIELLDARIPHSSRNPDIKELTKNKKRIILLNKSDLADEKITNMWVEHFTKNGENVLVTDSATGKGIEKVNKKINDIMADELAKKAAKGIKNKTIRVMILGIPNVGKSSFINRVSKKVSMVVGNKPGVTRQKQWIRIGTNQELLDTPGVLWPKFESTEVGLNLAYTGTIKDDILERIEIAYNCLEKIYKEYKLNVIDRYKITEEELADLEQTSHNLIYDLMLLIGKKRGAIVSGGRVDEEKVARIILDDFRSGKLGKISLERP